jgi:hypothetical protein
MSILNKVMNYVYTFNDNGNLEECLYFVEFLKLNWNEWTFGNNVRFLLKKFDSN